MVNLLKKILYSFYYNHRIKSVEDCSKLLNSKKISIDDLKQIALKGNLYCSIFLSQKGLSVLNKRRTFILDKEFEDTLLFTSIASVLGDNDAKKNLDDLLTKKEIHTKAKEIFQPLLVEEDLFSDIKSIKRLFNRLKRYSILSHVNEYFDTFDNDVENTVKAKNKHDVFEDNQTVIDIGSVEEFITESKLIDNASSDLKVCIFDLDNTLIKTDDLEKIRLEGKNLSNHNDYIRRLTEQFHRQSSRLIISVNHLNSIRTSLPNVKICIFSNAPKIYVNHLLSLAYPTFAWDSIVAYEDVKRHKPNADGIQKIIRSFPGTQANHIVMIGDSSVDIQAAEHAGCCAILMQSGWDRKYKPDYWRSINRLPDIIVSNVNDLIGVLAKPNNFLPILEQIYTTKDLDNLNDNFIKVNKFSPMASDKRPYPVHGCGRYIVYKSNFKLNHILSKSILDNKNATEFPIEWLIAIRKFLELNYNLAGFSHDNRLLITSIPARPGRENRLFNLLMQLKKYLKDSNINVEHIDFVNLFKYKMGVKSNHADRLKSEERFLNTTTHLELADSYHINNEDSILILDDVCTTGASFIAAIQLLERNKYFNNTCLAIALTR